MESIADVAAFCKAQAEYHTKKATWRKQKPEVAAAHRKLSEQFETAAAIALQAPTQPLVDNDPEQQDLFAIDPFDFGDLPEDLINELAISRADQEDAQIIRLFRIAQRPLSINEVMVGLYRKFSVQTKRPPLSARLYRMSTRGDLTNVEKGVYALPATGELKLDRKD